MKRRVEPSASSSASSSDLLRRVVAKTSVSKTALAKVLVELHLAGMLAEGVIASGSVEKTRKAIGRATNEYATRHTPYGPVIQTMQLDTNPATLWDFLHPMALLYLLCEISPPFCELMCECISNTTSVLRLVIYIDEFRPGNVLRPDAGRATQNILWAFVDWPEWVLCKSDSWLTFGCLRSVVLSSLPGGVSHLMKKVLLTFFGVGGPNFGTGVALPGRGGAVLCRAGFAGFLGDEKGMKVRVKTCRQLPLHFEGYAYGSQCKTPFPFGVGSVMINRLQCVCSKGYVFSTCNDLRLSFALGSLREQRVRRNETMFVLPEHCAAPRCV